MAIKEIAKNLYIYAYPLVWTKVLTSSPKEAFININHSRVIALPGKDSYKPNQDTLYSFLPMQLKNSPYELEIPKLDDNRYLLVNTLNTKTEIHFATGSKDENNGAGKYIFLYREDPVPAGYEDYKVVRSDDSLVILLVRVEAFDKEDYPKANRIQDNIIVNPITPERIKDNGTPIPGDFVSYIENLPVDKFYSLFYELLEDTKVDDIVFEYSKELGIDPENFDYGKLSDEIKAVLEEGAKEGYQEIINYDKPDVESNNWKVYAKDVATFGDNYLLRAFVAWYAWGANLPEDAIYPVLYVDANGNKLSSQKNYKVHFSKLPEAKHFWSFIVYGEPSGNLQKNDLDIYTYNTHGLPGYIINEDGSLDIYLSRVKPGDLSTVNYLPLPSDDPEFSILLRFYGASENVLTGKWEFPVVSEV